jgi:Tfp pilus assembly protein FimT
MDSLIIAAVIALLVVLALPTIRDFAGLLRTNERARGK